MAVLSLPDVKLAILQSFERFKADQLNTIQEFGYSISLDGLTQTDDWAPGVVVEAARQWWVNEEHGDLTSTNEGYAKQTGPAWSPAQYAGTRGPAVKSYSNGRAVVNFEFTDRLAMRRFNYHVPLFPRLLALAPLPGPAPAAAHGWKLLHGAWVHKGPGAWGRKEPRGF